MTYAAQAASSDSGCGACHKWCVNGEHACVTVTPRPINGVSRQVVLIEIRRLIGTTRDGRETGARLPFVAWLLVE